MPLTSIPTYATGDPIEASWANTLRDNALVLDNRTGGDPGAAGKILLSSSSTAGSWLAPGSNGLPLRISSGIPSYGTIDQTALASGTVVNHLGYTPVNPGGDTFTGLILHNAAVDMANGQPLRTRTNVGASANAIFMDGSNNMHIGHAGFIITFDSAAVSLSAGSKVVNDVIIHAGNIGAQSVASAASATNATQLGGVAASGYPTLASGGNFTTAPTIGGDAISKIATGSYSGVGGADRQITCGFVPKYVRLTGRNGAGTAFLLFDIMEAQASVAHNMRLSRSTGGIINIAECAETYIHATDGFNVNGSGLDASDSSGNTYHWTAFG